jgi:hypothetical protein
VFAGGILLQQTARADASYQETTQMTGGSLLSMMKMARMFSSKARDLDKPVTSTVMVHGNKMVHLRPTSTEIVDLDQQTITNIDLEKRQYTVMTFAQIQEAMNNAANKAKEAKQQPANSNSDSPNVQMKFNAKVSNSGAVKQIDGREAREALLMLTMDAQSTDNSNAKGSMAVTNEMWMIDDAPGYEEIRQFQMRMGKLLAANMNAGGMAAMMNAQPGASEALANLKKESEKMKGIPVQETMRMGLSADGQPLPPPSVQPTPKSDADNGQSSSEQSSNDQTPKLSSLGKMMGNSTFGSMMRRKKSQTNTPDSSASQNSAGPSSATLLETSTYRSKFSADQVDLTRFDIPAGYKQVETPRPRN